MPPVCCASGLLETHRLGEAIFAAVGERLQARGLRLSGGTLVDAALIAASSSTENAERARAREMKQIKKGKPWHFGMKVHVGADARTGVVHAAVVTAANVTDKHAVPDLLHGEEDAGLWRSWLPGLVPLKSEVQQGGFATVGAWNAKRMSI